MRRTRVLPGLLLLTVLGSMLACPAPDPIDPGGGGGFPGGNNGGGRDGGTDGGTPDGGRPDGGGGGGGSDGGFTGLDLRFKFVPTGQTYSGDVAQVTSDPATAAANLANNGHAIAGALWNSAGYTLLGVKPLGTPRTYLTDTRTSTSPGLGGTMSSLGSGGFVVTGFTFNDFTGYNLVGLKPLGENRVFTSSVQQVSGLNLGTAAQSLATSGFVVTGLFYNSAGYNLVGFKENGVTRSLSADVRSATAAELANTVQALGTAGYVVTAIVYVGSNVGYTLVSMKDNTESRTFTTNVQLVSGNNLKSTLQTLGAAGFITTAAYSDDSLNGYLLVGTK
ncbi:MAG TPA: hypothetical protein VK447_07340 [Myxococcaceae bacterium]|nr:hypothetical protein [Myxococcaceae bacterium]